MKKENDLEKSIHMYLKEIRRMLCCKHSIKKSFLSRLQSSIEDYLENHPEATIDDIISAFGTPEEIAEGFVPEANVSFTKDQRLKRKAIFITIAIVILAAISVIICAAIISYNNYIHSNGYYEETVIDHGVIYEEDYDNEKIY